MNEPQIAFDQRLQAIHITMTRPRFETFSIRGPWNCVAGSLHVLASIEALHAYSHQQIVQRRPRLFTRQFRQLICLVRIPTLCREENYPFALDAAKLLVWLMLVHHSMRFCAGTLGAVCVLGLWLTLAAGLHAAEGRKTTLPPVTFSVPRGYHDAPVTVQLGSPVNEASIRYTRDGSEPTPTNGRAYNTPLLVTNTTLLRAAAFQNGKRVSAIGTHSYLFLDQIVRQSAAPDGLPSGRAAWSGQPSAYRMDPRVVDDPVYRGRLRDAFLALPVVSVVCPQQDMFGPRGLYLNTMERGDEWERPCSTEMILPDGHSAFQVDCGLRIQGGMNRVPAKTPKHAFRLVFKTEYGAARLRYPIFPDSSVTNFNTLVLRADYNNSWIHWDPEQAARGQRIRDAWMKDTARAMGWTAPHNRYVHLFLNGLYWGVYDFTERPDADFATSYLGKTRDGYDVINAGELKDGTDDAFKQLAALPDVRKPEQYQQFQRLLDITNYIDYLLLHYYAGNQDWGDNKNCYLIRRRAPAGPFQYVVWDGEHVLNDADDDVVNDVYAGLFPLATKLRASAEFRRAFAARVRQHCFGDGALTPKACATRWMKRAAEVDRAMIAESARWGYYRRNPPFTHDGDYLQEQKRLIMLYFPQRTRVVLQQLQKAGLYPEVKNVP
jgi:hypothetical protein